MPAFARTIGIDYSGAETPTASLKGLRVYQAEGDGMPVEALPPPSPRKYWTRKGIAEWLVERLGEDVPTLVGIDHGFSFPLRYFEAHGLLPDWQAFLDDFQRHWPTDEDHTYVDFVRTGAAGNGMARMGNARWRRLTEERAGGAKSVFHFDVPGSVAKSTHAGIPWLRFIRQRLGARSHFWPFDGWDIPAGRSAIAEVYPALWSRQFPDEGRTSDQHDAFSITAWLSRADRDGRLATFLKPDLSLSDRTVAQVEGWILGVCSLIRQLPSVKIQAAELPTVAPLPVQRKAELRMTKACPECGRAFRDGTWAGIDAHWKAFHSDIMPYQDAWPIIKTGGKPSLNLTGQFPKVLR
jgi:hypothetical protein